MSVSFQSLLQRGGKEQMQLLSYFVRSMNVDQLFLFLAGDYKMMPAATKGIALYEVFLHPQTVARISSGRLLPQKDMRLANEIEKLTAAYLEHQNWQPSRAERADGASGGQVEPGSIEPGSIEPVQGDSVQDQPVGIDSVGIDSVSNDLERVDDQRPLVPLPANYLFDAVVTDLRLVTAAKLAEKQEQYDPGKTPTENLPGGAMNEAQRRFVDQIWVPKIRPYLVSAGFRSIASVA